MLKDIVYSVVRNKCAKCHQGDIFIYKNAYNLKKFDKMYESCSHCGTKYEKEPGFFYGAMYVSYALMSALFISSFVIDNLWIHSQTWQYMTFIVLAMILSVPLTYRLARLIWINFFTKFEQDSAVAQKTNN
jgi:uncharacterized protein (DUF983 family)